MGGRAPAALRAASYGRAAAATGGRGSRGRPGGGRAAGGRRTLRRPAVAEPPVAARGIARRPGPWARCWAAASYGVIGHAPRCFEKWEGGTPAALRAAS